MQKRQRLVDLYAFPGFRPRAGVLGVFGDPSARLVFLERRGKKPGVGYVAGARVESTNGSFDGYEIFRQEQRAFIWNWRSGGFFVAAAGR
jgi:hypothetical protein